jgi:probable rRNA maturation factor
MMVLIKDSQKALKVDRKAIQNTTEKLLVYSGLQDRDLSILLVDNRKSQTLNLKFFGRDRPTNVISFSYLDGPPHEVVGDIIVSVEKAMEEAEASNIPFYERLYGLIVHGFVHILGYDHETGEKERRRMKYREKRFLDRLLSDSPQRQSVIGKLQ